AFGDIFGFKRLAGPCERGRVPLMRGDRRGLVHPLLPLEIQERYVADGHWTEDTFARLVAKQGSRTPDRAALVGERSFTYRDLDDAGDALAGGILDLVLSYAAAVV